MPYIRNDEDWGARVVPDENERPGLHVSPVVGGGGLPANTPNAAPAAPATDPSRFVNFDRYLAANAGTNAATGQRLAAGVERAGQAATGAVDSAVQRFGQDATAGTQSFGGQGVSDVYNPRGGGDSKTGVTRQGLAGTPQRADLPTTPDRVSIDEVRRRASAGYTGPKSLMDAQYGYDQMASGLRSVADRARGLGSGPAGVQAALGNGGTSGGRRWASAMVSAANQDRFGELANRYGGIEDYLTAARAGSERTAQSAETASRAAGDQWRDLGNRYDRERPSKADEEQEYKHYRAY